MPPFLSLLLSPCELFLIHFVSSLILHPLYPNPFLDNPLPDLWTLSSVLVLPLLSDFRMPSVLTSLLSLTLTGSRFGTKLFSSHWQLASNSILPQDLALSQAVNGLFTNLA